MIEEIVIPVITLDWSDWHTWADIHSGIVIPPNHPGVYEARLSNSTEFLTIGKAANLRDRVRGGLVKSTRKHSSGKKIRANEDVSNVVVRWAITSTPAAAEEALHHRYKDKFGELPKHTVFT